MATPAQEIEARLARLYDPPECSMCEGEVPQHEIVTIGVSTYHLPCGILAAAGIASSALEGGEETVQEVMQSAEILSLAARDLWARLGGRAA